MTPGVSPNPFVFFCPIRCGSASVSPLGGRRTITGGTSSGTSGARHGRLAAVGGGWRRRLVVVDGGWWRIAPRGFRPLCDGPRLTAAARPSPPLLRPSISLLAARAPPRAGGPARGRRTAGRCAGKGTRALAARARTAASLRIRCGSEGQGRGRGRGRGRRRGLRGG